MSGGAFNYEQVRLAEELFGWNLNCTYGEGGHEQGKTARSINPMCDREMSELVWDVLCLIHSLDWYKSGDTDEDDYRADVKWFKDKWLKRSAGDALAAYKDDIMAFTNEILKEIGEKK